MPERVWYRSLYWRIALGYVALLAVLLLVQTGLTAWVTDRMWGRASRTPDQLAELVAEDVEAQLTQTPRPDFDVYLQNKYGSGYQPFVVVLIDEKRTFFNRPTAVHPNLEREARGRLMGRGPGGGFPGNWRAGLGHRFGGSLRKRQLISRSPSHAGFAAVVACCRGADARQ